MSAPDPPLLRRFAGGMSATAAVAEAPVGEACGGALDVGGGQLAAGSAGFMSGSLSS
jgi:hypothetical protein